MSNSRNLPGHDVAGATEGPVALRNSSKIERAILKFWIYSSSVKLQTIISQKSPTRGRIPRMRGLPFSKAFTTHLRCLWLATITASAVVSMEINLPFYNIHDRNSWTDLTQEEKTHLFHQHQLFQFAILKILIRMWSQLLFALELRRTSWVDREEIGFSSAKLVNEMTP